MWNMIATMWLCLLIATILGAIFGWLLKSLSCKSESQKLRADLDSKDAELRASMEASRKAKAEMDTKFARFSSFESDLESAQANLKTHEAALRDRDVQIDGFKNQLLVWEKSGGDKDGEITALKAKIAEKDGEIKLRSEAHQKLEAEIISLRDAKQDTKVASMDVENKLKATEAELAKLQAAAFARDEENRKYAIRISELEKSSVPSDGGQEVIDLRAKIATLTGDLSSTNAKLAAATAAGAVGRAVVASGGGSSDFDDLGVKFTDWGTDYEMLRRRIEKVEGLATDDDEDTEEEIDAWITETKEMQATIKDLRARIDDFDESQHSSSKEILHTRLKDLDGMQDALLRILGRAKKNKQEGILKVKRKGYEKGIRDDLKEILGVGPVLEKLLNENNVWTFKQIGLWTSDDIESMSDKLENFSTRITRDDWVTQSKDLHQKYYGENI